MKLKQITKKILAFGLAVATTCASFLSVPQNAFADSPDNVITVVDYAGYGSQKAAFDAVMTTNRHGDKYGYSIRGDSQFYWVTKANQASNPASFRYNVFGWSIVVTGSNGIVGTAEYANDGGIIKYGTKTEHWINPVEHLDGGYYYRVSSIEVSDLQAGLSNPAAMSGSSFTVKAYPIMTTRNAGSTLNNGTITQISNGVVSTTGAIYRLSTEAGYKALLGTASWSNASKDTFANFHNGRTIISDGGNTEISLHPTEIEYYIEGQESCAYSVDSTGRITGVSEANSKFSSTSSATILSNSELQATKTGYEMDSYWTICSEGDNAVSVSMGANINSSNGLDTNGDGIVKLKANWKKNRYYIAFDANGGNGTIGTLTTLYDDYIRLQDGSFLTKTGNVFVGWNTKADGSGTTYQNQESVINLTSVNNATVQLYAMWEADEYEIDLNKCGGTGGDDEIFETYGNGYSKTSKGTFVSTINAPSKLGYQLEGYYTGKEGSGSKITNKTTIVGSNTYFTSDILMDTEGNGGIYANYDPNRINVIFDKQNGDETTGSNGVVVLYERYYPSRETNEKGGENGASLRAPIRDGYTFKGYYTQPNGAGVQVYTQTMCPTAFLCNVPSGSQTLYAYWVDDIAPQIFITPESLAWYNGGADTIFQVKIDASDAGSGIAKIEYRVDDGAVSTVTYNGEDKVSTGFDITTEGIQTITATAYDKAGNYTTTMCTIYYDKTAPRVVSGTVSTPDNIKINGFVVTDYK